MLDAMTVPKDSNEFCCVHVCMCVLHIYMHVCIGHQFSPARLSPAGRLR